MPFLQKLKIFFSFPYFTCCRLVADPSDSLDEKSGVLTVGDNVDQEAFRLRTTIRRMNEEDEKNYAVM